MGSIRTYYYLTKPGIIAGNLVTTIGAFAFASKQAFHPEIALATIGGLALVVASAGVFNNYIDRHLDQQMDRTKRRPLATGTVSTTGALLFATSLGLGGEAILWTGANGLTALIALAGFLLYVILYGFVKTKTVH
ncbi:MAG: hypothetical protein RL235_726, partial [Chlamydiota bacterium]